MIKKLVIAIFIWFLSNSVQFCDAEGAAGKNRNDTFLFNKVSNLSTAGGTLQETKTVPKSRFSVRQGSLVVTEWGVGIPFTQKLQSLSEISVDNTIKVKLRDDMAKVLDSKGAAAQFKTTKWKVTVDATNLSYFTTDGAASKTMTGQLSDVTARDIIDKLKQNNIPKRNGDYIAICSVQALRGLYDYFEVKAYTGGAMEKIYNGEVGNYYGTRFIEESNVMSNTLGKGSTSGEALFLGADAVREGIVIPEEIRLDLAKDFGRDQAIGWYMLGGFKKVWDYSADSESHIIHLTSK